ncbi:MAG: extracellular solute-binding protein [Ruminiclostridium sp.]|nr:extracellular solute-binding protein [Ruminiclostridium sp.]
MRTRFTRITALFVSLLLAVSLFAGCGTKTGEEPTTQPTTKGTTAAPSETKAPLPIVTTPLTLSYATTWGNPLLYNSINDVTSYKEMEKRTGIHIDFRNIAADQAEEQFNLMMASGDLPDIIDWQWNEVRKSIDTFIDEGLFVKLNDWVDKFAPNYNKLLDSKPVYRKEIMTNGGNISGFMDFGSDESVQVWYGPVIRGDWLEKLGLKIPVTNDDWYTVLKAFKEKDPNGNGKPDELPITFNTWGNGLIAFTAANAFVGAWGIGFGYYQENGIIKYGPLEPGFKDFIIMINKWYKEKLVDPDYAATDGAGNDAKILNEQIGSFFAGASGGIGNYTGRFKTVNPNAKFIAAPYPVLKAGDKPQLGQNNGNIVFDGAVITKSCKNVEEAVRWLDYQYSEEGSLLINFGIEGQTYNMVDGQPVFTDAILKPATGTVDDALALNTSGNHGGPHISDSRMYFQVTALPQQREALKTWVTSTEKNLPTTFKMDAADIERNATKETDINTYVSEMVNKFIMGAEPIENFDAFVNKLKELDIASLIKARQTALDKFNAR